MPFDREIHHRRSIRLRGYDDAQGGTYFVTIGDNRAEIFGRIMDGQMQISAWGRILAEEWLKTAQTRCYVRVHSDECAVMPNHVHGIIWIVDDVDGAGTQHNAGACHDAGTHHEVGARRRRAPTSTCRPAPHRRLPGLSAGASDGA